MEKNVIDHRKVLYEWETPEFVSTPRGKIWYLVAGIVLGLLILYGIVSKSITMVLVFLAFAIVFLLLEKREPKTLVVQITDMGIFYHGEFYPFHHINSFWMVYHPPYIRVLYLKIRRGKRLYPLKIELNHENPSTIRKLLMNEIPEIEGAGEPFLDLLIRLLRLQ